MQLFYYPIEVIFQYNNVIHKVVVLFPVCCNAIELLFIAQATESSFLDTSNSTFGEGEYLQRT